MALETECILRPNLGTSADVPDVPSRTSMIRKILEDKVKYGKGITDHLNPLGDSVISMRDCPQLGAHVKRLRNEDL